MRPIKFRFWLHGNMQYEHDGWCEGIGINEAIECSQKTGVVMQFTGLLDRNGKEIYEDDVLKIDDEENESGIHRVKYFGSSGYPAFDLVPAIESDSNDLSHAMAVYQVTVIGNIHEHPDLLRGGE